MTSNVKKGYNKEKLARDLLISEGWKIMFKSIRWKFGTFDYGGLFDIVAYKEQLRKYVSCKHLNKGNYYLSHQLEIKNHKSKHGKENESYELWLWQPARYIGRGNKKHWNGARWVKIVI